MAENTKQFRYIVTIEGGIDALFREEPQVFVTGDRQVALANNSSKF